MPTLKYNRRGVALIWVAILSFVLFGFMALAVDTMWAMLVNHQLQNAADAAALAGARLVRQNQSQARLEARAYANLNSGGTNDDGTWATVQVDLNSGNDPLGDIVVGRYLATANPQFTPNTANPNAVLVRAPRVEGSLGGSQPLLFGYSFNGSNVTHANIKRSAIARVAGGLGAGLLVLDPRGNGPGDSALELTGGPDLSVLNGTIQVNSASDRAVRVQGNFFITGEELNIVGSMQNPPTTLPVNTGMPVLPDPLSWLVEPTPGAPIYDNGTQTTFSPGFYPNGIFIGTRDVEFQAGTYILGTPATTGDIFVLTSNEGSITGHGCTFFIAGGSLRWNGGSVDISPPPLDAGFYYEHVTVFQARNNASLCRINGNQDYHLAGTFYLPGRLDGSSGPLLHLTGTFGGSGGGIGEGVQVIAYRVLLQGTSSLTLYFDGWWPGPLNSRVYLVE